MGTLTAAQAVDALIKMWMEKKILLSPLATLEERGLAHAALLSLEKAFPGEPQKPESLERDSVV